MCCVGGSASPAPSSTAAGAAAPTRCRSGWRAASCRVAATEVREILGHLARDILCDQLGAEVDAVRDPLRIGAAMALQDHAVEAEEHRAIVVIGIEMVAQQLGRGARNQKAELRARRAGEGAAGQVGDETRRPLDRLQRDIRSEAHTSELQSIMRISYTV